MKQVKIGNSLTPMYQVGSPDVEEGRFQFYVWHVVTTQEMGQFDSLKQAQEYAAKLNS